MNRKILEKVLGYIDANIHEKISLGELSALTGYSPFHFSRLFSEAMGMPVTGYIRIRKLQHSIVSLLEGGKVLDVALMYAFDSHEGFTRAFSRHFGSTPATVKKHMPHYTVPHYLIPEQIKGGKRLDTTHNLTQSMHQLVFEILENSVDEANAGYCSQIDVTLLPEGKIRISDDGRGLPLSEDPHVSKAVLDKLLSGRPVTNAEYSQTGDFIQAGLQAVNSLCESLQFIVRRHNKRFLQDYVRGVAQHDLSIEAFEGHSGTEITLKPDTSIFGEIAFSKEMINNWLKEKPVRFSVH